MSKNYINILYLLIILFSAGCLSKDKKKFVKKYYPSGKLLSSGWYINDTIPVDTVFEYYENGKLLTVAIYDSTGKLNGPFTSYYENGKKQQVNNYENGQLQGFTFIFNKLGKLDSKIFSLNGKQIGDYYGYDKDGLLHAYAFYWNDTTYINYIEYDSLGKIIQDKRPVLFNNITTVRNLDTNNKIQKDYTIQLVISNPPKCRTKIKIEFTSNKGLLFRADSIENVPIYLSHLVMPDNLKAIKFSAIQYDSILNKYYNYNVVTKL